MADYTNFDEWYKAFNKRFIIGALTSRNWKKSLMEYLGNNSHLLTDFLNSNAKNKDTEMQRISKHIKYFILNPNKKTALDFAIGLGSNAEDFAIGLS